MALPKLGEIEWAEIRSAYEGENPNVSALAKRYGISRSLLQKRANAQGWVKGEVFGPERDPGPAVAPPADPRATEEEGATGFGAALQTRVLLGQQREWRRLDRLIREALAPLTPTWTPDGQPSKGKDGQPGGMPLHAREKYVETRLGNLQRMVSLMAVKQRAEREAYRIDLRTFQVADPVTAEQRAKAAAELQLILDTAKAIKQGTMIPGQTTQATS